MHKADLPYRPNYLMCAADFYRINPPDDPNGQGNKKEEIGYKVYSQNPATFVKIAKEQWDVLQSVLRNKLAAEITLMEPKEENGGDQVFTADPTFSLSRKFGEKAGTESSFTIVSHFTNDKRKAELSTAVASIQRAFPNRSFITVPINSEGTGDNVIDPAGRNMIFSGYVDNPNSTNPSEGRSSIHAHTFIAEKTGLKVLSLEVKDPFFHIDTSMAPLPGGELIVYPGGMSSNAYSKLKAEALDKFNLPHDEYLIEVSKADAHAYACNLVVSGDQIVMPEVSQELQDRIKRRGYDVHTVNLSHFIHAGGGPHCLTNLINQDIPEAKNPRIIEALESHGPG